MNGKNKTIAGVGLVMLLILGWIVWQIDWNVRAIDRRLKTLAELVEKTGPESTFEAVGRSRQLRGFFTEDARIEYLPRRSTVTGSDAFSAAFLSVRNSLETAAVRLGRHEIFVDPSEREAESTVRASAKVVPQSGRTRSDTVDYRILWEKVDGEWRIAMVSVQSP